MKKMRTISLVIFFLILPVVLLISFSTVKVIPSWQFVQEFSIVSLWLISLFSACLLIVRFEKFFSRITKKMITTILTVLFSSVISIVLLFTIMISLIETSDFLSPRLINTLDYPSYNLTLYVYEDGFPDSKSIIKMKDETFPIMKVITEVSSLPSDLEIQREANYVKIYSTNEIVYIHLKTRKISKTTLL